MVQAVHMGLETTCSQALPEQFQGLDWYCLGRNYELHLFEATLLIELSFQASVTILPQGDIPLCNGFITLSRSP